MNLEQIKKAKVITQQGKHLGHIYEIEAELIKNKKELLSLTVKFFVYGKQGLTERIDRKSVV